MVGHLTELGGDSAGEGLAGDLRLLAAVAAGVWRRARENERCERDEERDGDAVGPGWEPSRCAGPVGSPTMPIK
jgi:hypothetical protein